MSSLEALLKAAQGQSATDTAAQAANDTKTVAITEADIKNNPLYNILQQDLDANEIIHQIADAVSKNPDLSQEENLQKIRDFAAVNKHFQDQMINLAQRLAEFSNDEALSLYDDAVTKLQERLVNFGNDISPLVRALQVIKDAEEQGKDPQELIDEVNAMLASKVELEKAIVQGDRSIADINKNIEALANRNTNLQQNISNNNTANANMQGQIDDLKGRFLGGWRYGKEIESLERRIGMNERENSSIVTTLEQNAKRQEEMEASRDEAKADLDGKKDQLTSVDSKLADDADYHAISTLIQITGSEYKGRRDDLVGNAKAFIDEAIQEFNSCIGRFESLELEIDDFSDVATNLVEQYYLIIKGAELGYKETEAARQEIQDRIEVLEAEKVEAGDEIDSPDLARARVDYQETKDFLNTFLPTRDSAVKFRSILAERQGEFTGLKGLVQAKRHDAEELRTNGAVAVASQLVMTLKTLEAAVAGQKTDTMRSMLDSFKKTARTTTEGLLDSLVSDQDKKNTRLVAALQGMVEMKVKLDQATDELLEKRTDEAGLTEAVVDATDRVVESAEDLKDTVSNARRLGKEKVTPEAAGQIVDMLEDTERKKADAPAAPKP